MRFHHIGIVCDKKLLKKLRIEKKIDSTYIDKYQKNRLSFYLDQKSKILYEFIFPLNKYSTTYNFFKKNGNGIHHYAFEVKNLKKIIILYKNKKNFIYINSYSANIKYLGGKIKTCFFYYKKNIIEFIEIEK